MATNPLVGIVYHQLKNDEIYEVVFPHSIDQSPEGRDAHLYQFQVKDPGVAGYKKYNIYLSGTLCAEKSEFERNISALRAVYSLLGTKQSKHLIGSDEFEKYYHRKEHDDTQGKYFILKYALDRYDKLFDKPFIVLEFLGAIKINPEQIIYDLRYFNDQGLLNFPLVTKANEQSYPLDQWPAFELIIPKGRRDEIERKIKEIESGLKKVEAVISTPIEFTGQEKEDKKAESVRDSSDETTTLTYLKEGKFYNVKYPKKPDETSNLGGPKLSFLVKESEKSEYQTHNLHFSYERLDYFKQRFDIYVLKVLYYLNLNNNISDIYIRKPPDVLYAGSVLHGKGKALEFQILLYLIQFGSAANSIEFTVSLTELLPVVQRDSNEVMSAISSLINRNWLMSEKSADIRNHKVHSNKYHQTLIGLNEKKVPDIKRFTDAFLRDNKNLPDEFCIDFLSDFPKNKEQAEIKSKSEIISPIDMHFGSGIVPAYTEYKKPEDALDYRLYADALGDLITNEKTGTPLTIGICGPWGRGKTVLMSYIKDRIKHNNQHADKSTHVDCKPIDFNAWKYSKAEEVWIAFYTKIVKELEDQLPFVKKRLFRWFVSTPLSRRLMWILIIVPLIYLGVLLLSDYDWSKIYTADKNIGWEGITSILSAATFLIAVIGIIVNLFRSLSTSILMKFKRPDLKMKPSLQDDIFGKFNRICEWFTKESEKQTIRRKSGLSARCPERLVVFVDDIDRCPPEKITQILEAIKMFLDKGNFVFLLAMDAKVVRMAVGEQYRFISRNPLKKERWGRFYLEKIIQIPFALPPLEPEHLKNMKNKLIKNILSKKEPEPTQDEIPEKPIEKPTEPPKPVEKPAAIDDEKENIPSEPTEINQPERSSVYETPEENEPPPVEINPELDMKLDDEESQWLDYFLSNVPDLSPRLLTRLINVYLIARHLYIENKGKKPPKEFLYWLAFSVRYPFETKEMTDIITKQMIKDWHYLIVQKCIQDHVKAGDLDAVMERQFGEINQLIGSYIENHEDIKKFTSITNLFNLILD